MSEIVTVDAEVIVPLDIAAAKRLDFKIRLMAATIRDNIAKIADLIEEAKNGEIHRALGFSSWTSYVADALGGQLELTTDSRRAVVELMAGEGMSQRAIAQAVGVSQKTVDRDLDKVSHPDSPVCHEPSVSTGLDGKDYPRPAAIEPKPRRRRPITEAFGSATYDLTKVVRRLESLSDDDRFDRNTEALNSKFGDLVRARDAIERILLRLDGEGLVRHDSARLNELMATAESVAR